MRVTAALLVRLVAAYTSVKTRVKRNDFGPKSGLEVDLLTGRVILKLYGSSWY